MRLQKWIWAVLAFGIYGVALAEDITHDVNYQATVNYDQGAIWKIKGTQVTATAAEINNAADGLTATPAEVNASCDADVGETTRYIAGNTETMSFDTTSGVTKAVLQLQSEGAAASSQNTNGATFDVNFRMNNKAGGTTTGVINYAQMRLIADDTTGGSEDASYYLIIPIAGTTTTVVKVNLTGMTLTGSLAASSVTAGTPVLSSVVSNYNGTLITSNLTVTTAGTVSFPAASIASDDLPSIIANSAFSNTTGRVNCSNLTVTAGSTVTFPAASIAKDALNSTYHFAGVGSNITIAVTNGLITSITLI